MIPIFKTHASIGKSILTSEKIFSLVKKAGLKEVVFVEDSMYGFRETKKLAEKNDVKLIFGLRLPVVQEDNKELPSKLVFFAKNGEGIKQIKNLYTKTYCSPDSLLVIKDLGKHDLADIQVVVPFYDSYIYNNLFHFGMSDIQLKGKVRDIVFMEEDNGHPFDRLISAQLGKMRVQTLAVKSVYYENRSDAEALQFYKAVCCRSQGGKSPSFGNPNLSHFCSREFCWESYINSQDRPPAGLGESTCSN